jgi:hypothetical protein
VACDDDSCAGGEPGPGPVLAGDSQASRIASVVLTGGTTYYVRVGSFDYTSSPIETGSFQVVVSNVNPLGACCETSGACTQTDAARCTVAGAVFTAGNACSPNSCPQPGACCDPATGGCTLASVIGGTGCPVGNTYLGDNTTCTPNTCPQPDGACCCGSSCSLTPPAACTGTNTQFMGTGTVCNVAGNNTTPCCRADYNQSGSVSVQDIFDFLGGYFSLNPCADVNGSGPPPSVQDIFDFLAAYFAGCV